MKIQKQYSFFFILICICNIDFRERIGANIMCSDSVLHMKSALPYWPSNQNGVSAVVAQIYQPTEAKNRVTSWLWVLVPHLFHVLQDDGSPPDWSKNIPPFVIHSLVLLCDSLLLPVKTFLAPVWETRTSLRALICGVWVGEVGVGGLLVWAMNYRDFQLK